MCQTITSTGHEKCATMVHKKQKIIVMQSAVPVVDHMKRAALGEIKSNSPFNIINIAALVAILVIGYFLYKKFNEKFQKGAIQIPQVNSPLTKVKEAVSLVAQAAEVPPPEDDKHTD
jgi:hypothetical protein